MIYDPVQDQLEIENEAQARFVQRYIIEPLDRVIASQVRTIENLERTKAKCQ